MLNEFRIDENNIENCYKNVSDNMKTVSIKPFINIESNSKRSEFGYSVTEVERKNNFLAVVTPPYIYHYVTMAYFKI